MPTPEPILPAPAAKHPADLSPRMKRKLDELIEVCRTAPKGTRSGKDFHLCCWSHKHGIEKNTIWQMVENIGKFAEDRSGEYFDRTWANAERSRNKW